MYDGVRESLEQLNHRRKKALDQIKTTRARKRRVKVKTLRTQEAQQRKLWSKQHGQDTYGDEEELMDEKGASKWDRKEKTAKKPCNRCGSKTHSRSTHRDCPYNKPAKDEPADTAAVTGKSPTTYSATELGDSDDSTTMEGYSCLMRSSTWIRSMM